MNHKKSQNFTSITLNSKQNKTLVFYIVVSLFANPLMTHSVIADSSNPESSRLQGSLDEPIQSHLVTSSAPANKKPSAQSGYQMLSPEQIEQNLNTAEQQANQQSSFALMHSMDNQGTPHPTAKLDGEASPIGLNLGLNLPPTPQPINESYHYDYQNDNQSNKANSNKNNKSDTKENTNKPQEYDKKSLINPDDYLPDYQAENNNKGNDNQTDIKTPDNNGKKQPSLFTKVKANLFNNGLVALPKINSHLYIKTNQQPATLIAADSQQQPYKNIKAALDNIYVDTIDEFNVAVPTIRKTAIQAAEAVGYYDVKMLFRPSKQTSNFNGKTTSIEEIDVIIESTGEPVIVNDRTISIRGDGARLDIFKQMQDTLPPLAGSVFNQGAYTASTAILEAKSQQMGMFDSQWLIKSADVTLPDNIADIDLVYDTKKRYQFGEVIFFTLDKDTGKLTTDPDKLPLEPALLQQLLTFNNGDAYYQPKVTELRNDLSATRYFNAFNVEEVLPSSEEETSNDDTMSPSLMVNDSSGNRVDVAFIAFPSGMPESLDKLTVDNLVSGSLIADDNNSNQPKNRRQDNKDNAVIVVNTAVEADNNNPLINTQPHNPNSKIDSKTDNKINNINTDGINNQSLDKNLDESSDESLDENLNEKLDNQNDTNTINKFDGSASSILDNLINQTLNTAIAEQENDKQLATITFAIDDSTNDKYQAIESKAYSLLDMPDDRILKDDKSIENKTALAKIGNAISSVAKTILPNEDENQPIKAVDERPILARKITPQQVKANKKVPLYVMVLSNKPYDAQIGLGYGTDTGIRVTSKLDNNLINRQGYRAGLSAEWSKAEKKINFNASRPWKHPLNDTLNASLSYEELTKENNNSADWNTKSLSSSFARNRRSVNGWNRSYALNYRYDELERDNTDGDIEDLPVRFNASKTRQQALLLGYSMYKSSADDLTNPTSGIRQEYSLEAGFDKAGTDTNMAILKAGVKGIHSFGDGDKHQLIGKINAGYLWADDFYNVPYTLRFFAGGDQSIRGYDYKSLSPIDNGYLTGGQILGISSLEYNYQFKEGLRGAVFTDVGNAYDTDFTTPTKVGVGFGIRWASPVGPVRLDVGAGVTEESIPVRLYLFIGSPL